MSTFILADNQELTRFALERLLVREEDSDIRRVSDRAGLLQTLKETDGDCIVILDYTLFDFADEEQLLIVSDRYSDSQWVLISEDLTVNLLRKVIYSSHQFSIVFKDATLDEVRQAIHSAVQHRRYLCQRATEMVLAQQETSLSDPLTASEIEILRCIAQGKTSKVIAQERFSSIHTINTHKKNIFRKLSVNTAHEAIKYALRAGIVDPSEFYI
ncbi:response regulator transcription factor [Prevotella sp. E9-3]|uniref:response regulator transcription factor n=1 Tax=Prevotella sp. E9-3 TaxID=2913621 RepID=UPI001EDB95E5|nr:response regulator transcription factor [Prevotella sp. E9-3]UKK48683.1 response regulator transcription factor [Prevotella sp. E9-3]